MESIWEGTVAMTTISGSIHSDSPSACSTLSKAVIRSAKYLRIAEDSLAEILRLDSPTIRSLFEGTYFLNQERTQEWESAILLVRLFLALDTLMGDQESAGEWLHGFNTAFTQSPADRIHTLEGLISVVEYLEFQVTG